MGLIKLLEKALEHEVLRLNEVDYLTTGAEYGLSEDGDWLRIENIHREEVDIYVGSNPTFPTESFEGGAMNLKVFGLFWVGVALAMFVWFVVDTILTVGISM